MLGSSFDTRIQEHMKGGEPFRMTEAERTSLQAEIKAMHARLEAGDYEMVENDD